MQADVLDLRGAKVRTIDLDDRVFGIKPNRAVVHQAVVAQQANARQGTADTKTRGEVAGGGKKPYRQKGTGYARQGSNRAPHYRKGGVVFGPHPRSYHKDLPRKMRRLAMRSVLSARLAEQALTVVDAFDLAEPRTKVLLQMLSGLGVEEGAVVVLGERVDPIWRAARNLERVHVVTPNGLNLLDILRLPRLVLTESAVQELTRTLTSDLTPSGAPSSGESPSGGAKRGGPGASAAVPLVAEGAHEPAPPKRRTTRSTEPTETPEAEPAETPATDEEHQP
jgi:large subunit ribosomal protein L4